MTPRWCHSSSAETVPYKTAYDLRGPNRDRIAPETAVLAQEPEPPFHAHAFLESAGLARRIAEYPRSAVIFSQGDPADSVLYIQAGSVKLSVLSASGRQATLAILGPGDFFGEGCLAAQPIRVGSATATTACAILVVLRDEMARVLHTEPSLSGRFIAHLLTRNIRIEEDLVDQLFNASEKRLARTLLLLARYGIEGKPARYVPPISQEALAEMVGTTRTRVNFFLRKFRRLGFIAYEGRRIEVKDALLTVVLHD